MQRFFLLACAANGFLAVALGAFGAHGLKSALANAPDGSKRLDWWETAAQYHLLHALALGLIAMCATSAARSVSAVGYASPSSSSSSVSAVTSSRLGSAHAPSSALRIAGFAMLAGIAMFSGSLYGMSLSGFSRLGMITPLGGLCFLIGWAAIALDAWGRRAG